MKINESTSNAGLNIAGVSPAATRPARSGADEQTAPQELSLTAAGRAVFAERTERIAELRSLVASGAYSPPAQSVVGKMVDEALSRPA